MSQLKITHPDPKVQEHITERQQSFTDGFNNASVPALMAMFAEDVEFNDYGTWSPSLPLQVHAKPSSYRVLNLNRTSIQRINSARIGTSARILRQGALRDEFAENSRSFSSASASMDVITAFSDMGHTDAPSVRAF